MIGISFLGSDNTFSFIIIGCWREDMNVLIITDNVFLRDEFDSVVQELGLVVLGLITQYL